jgi:hypothetical protein
MIYLRDKVGESDYTFPNTDNPAADFSEFWRGAPPIAAEYIRTRQQNGGVIRDYSFDSLNTNEDTSEEGEDE